MPSAEILDDSLAIEYDRDLFKTDLSITAEIAPTPDGIWSDSGEVEDQTTGLISATKRGEVWRITPGDPLSARSDFDWSRTMARGDWAVRVDTTMSQWADQRNFHIEATLKAFEGSEKVFEKTFSEKVPRA